MGANCSLTDVSRASHVSDPSVLFQFGAVLYIA